MTEASDDSSRAHQTMQNGWSADEHRLKIFVSYSRQDSIEFAQSIVAGLEASGLATKLDTRDLEFGVAWQSQLKDFIRQADAVVFIVTPRSIRSHWCRWELAAVAQQSKRLVPVIQIPVDVEEVPAEIGNIQLFQAKPGIDFQIDDAASFSELIGRLAAGLSRDREWIEDHTRITELAYVWAKEARSQDHLLRGSGLRSAESWMARRPNNSPAPSRAQLDFIAASQAAAKSRANRWISGVATVAFSLAALTAAAVWQRGEALIQRDNVLRNESKFLADQARQSIASGDVTTAIGLSLEALPDPDNWTSRPITAEAEKSLLAAFYANREVLRVNLPHGRQLAVSGSRSMAAFTDSEGAVQVVSTLSGEVIKTIGLKGEVLEAQEFSPDGDSLLTVDKTATRLWNVRSSQEQSSLKLSPGSRAMRAVFCADESKLAIVDNFGVLHIWSPADQAASSTIETNGAYGDVSCSKDGSHVITSAGLGQSVELWRLADGKKVAWRDNCFDCLVALSKDGRHLALTHWSEVDPPKLAHIETLASVKLDGHQGPVNRISFSPNSTHIVTASDDTTARVWLSENGQSISELRGHDGSVKSADILGLRDSKILVITGGSDGTARIWDGASGKQLALLPGHSRPIVSVQLSAQLSDDDASFDTARALTADDRGSVRVWDVTNLASPVELYAFRSDGFDLAQATFDAVGSAVIANDARGNAIAWSIAQPVGRFDDPLAMTPDGKLIAKSKGKSFIIFDTETQKQICTIPLKKSVPRRAAFSGDGAAVAVADESEIGIWRASDCASVASIPIAQTELIDLNSGATSLVVAMNKDEIRVYDWTGQLRVKFPNSGERISAVAISPNGSVIATAGYDAGARMFSATDGQELVKVAGDALGFRDVAFNPSGTELVTLSSHRVLQSWSLAGVEIRTSPVLADQKPTARMRFTPSGSLLTYGNILLDPSTLQLKYSGSERTNYRIVGWPISDRRAAVFDFGKLVLQPIFTEPRSLTRHMRISTPACLAPSQRRPPLAAEPVSWCIDMRKWPYDSEDWRQWLAITKSGRSAPLPDVNAKPIGAKQQTPTGKQ